ncbi:hypothetical protein BRC62_04535 [Halobacteriales archaeon QH_10_67_13]|nr:MAG: hypothetical protein BRC62_04535 [Halobacteriales archaeon QH_10_67_13]
MRWTRTTREASGARTSKPYQDRTPSSREACDRSRSMIESDADGSPEKATREAAVPCPTCDERLRREELLSGIAFVCENSGCVELLLYESNVAATRSDTRR